MDQFPLTAVPLVSPHLRERLRTQMVVTRPTVTQWLGTGVGFGGRAEPPVHLDAGDQLLIAQDGSGFGVYRDGQLSETYELRDGTFRPIVEQDGSTIGMEGSEAVADAEPPIVTVFGQLRSGEIHEFGTVGADAGDTAQDVMEALGALLRACADHIPTVIVDPELGPDAARWSPAAVTKHDD